MRFAKLALNRYGRFEDCELDFTSGALDLHVIYGPNEAGKSTSLSAVSDLLFGFPRSSPYDFRFDYSLMSVGGVLEDGDTKLACTRRKSGGATLIGEGDLPIEQGVILAMLRGQTRESFRLSFSLDQTGLREGGRAMVEARDDVGQALFAAGFGLTRVSSEIATLNAEADAIWGRRAKASRSYTQAERSLQAGLRAVRDLGLRPKTWSDARKLVEATAEALAGLEARRDMLLAKFRRDELVRRVAGGVRLRDVLIAEAVDRPASAALTPQAEASAEQAISDTDEATATRTVAERLALDVERRIDLLAPDEGVLAASAEIQALSAEAGAVEKAANDLPRLLLEQDAAAAEVARLQEEVGAPGEVRLARPVMASLREMARGHATDAAASRELSVTEAELKIRRKDLEVCLADAELDVGLPALVAAVEAARRLGPEADLRCITTARRAADAAGKAAAARAVLAPWAGGAADLKILRFAATAELDAEKAAWTEYRAAMRRESDAVERVDDAMAELELQLGVEPGIPILSADELRGLRGTREAAWSPLRSHLLGDEPPVDLVGSIGLFERASAEADAAADARFETAETSARTAALIDTLRARRGEAARTRKRMSAAEERFTAVREAWNARLAADGLPVLEPLRMQSWTDAARAAIAADEDWERLEGEAQDAASQCGAAMSALRVALDGVPLPDDGGLAVLLMIAEGARATGEEHERRFRQDRSDLRQVDADLDALRRRKATLEADAGDRARRWAALLEGVQLAITIDSAEARLETLDELRVALDEEQDLARRIAGIKRDAERFAERLGVLADNLGVDASLPGLGRLAELQKRLDAARGVKLLLADLSAERDRRKREATDAQARIDAANLILVPLFTATGTSDAPALAECIERSRERRAADARLKDLEATIIRDGDGLGLVELGALVAEAPPAGTASPGGDPTRELAELNTAISEAAAASGAAGRAFSDLDSGSETAVGAAADAEQAKAELAVLADAYIRKRVQAVALGWAIERYRERNQGPLLKRASELFAVLTLGRYSALRVETDAARPRLLGLCDDGRSVVEVGAMSEGTVDQLFLALRLAALDQSLDAGIRLPFIADDLFVNFDDDRAAAGLRVLGDIARRTQVLFFTHHPHLVAIAKNVLGAEVNAECVLK